VYKRQGDDIIDWIGYIIKIFILLGTLFLLGWVLKIALCAAVLVVPLLMVYFYFFPPRPKLIPFDPDLIEVGDYVELTEDLEYYVKGRKGKVVQLLDFKDGSQGFYLKMNEHYADRNVQFIPSATPKQHQIKKLRTNKHEPE
jgi:hypothetical protein